MYGGFTGHIDQHGSAGALDEIEDHAVSPGFSGVSEVQAAVRVHHRVSKP